MNDKIILSVNDVSIKYPGFKLNNISFDLKENEALSIVGRSGSGKSTLANIISGLEKPDTGEILFPGGTGRDKLQIIYQNPFSSLDPAWKISDIIFEPVSLIKNLPGIKTKNDKIDFLNTLLLKVGLPPGILHKTPKELSGGERQRIAIARALAVQPKLLIADEPTSSLDVSNEKDILSLIKSLCTENNTGLIFITHNILAAEYITDKCILLDNGRIAESGLTKEIISCPKSPEGIKLIQCLNSLLKNTQ